MFAVYLCWFLVSSVCSDVFVKSRATSLSVVDKSATFRRPSPPPSSGRIIPLMMEAEMVSETLGFFPQLTLLVAREDFIEFSRRESFKSFSVVFFSQLEYNASTRSE
jgi:hypothetical protein